jgi:energy-coupling factor transporter ATP-binding protein EcfA2
MINSITIRNGFLTEMPGFHPGKRFDFGEGITVLFGPNGVGKSSVIKMLKAYCGIEKGGWSRISSPLALGAQSASHFPWVYRQYSPGQSDCIVDWDGTASFYNDGDVKIDQWAWFTHNEILSEDGMTTETEQMQFLMDKPSSGQYRLAKLNKLLNMMESPPDLTICPPSTDPSQQPYHPTQMAECQYIRSLPRNGKPTLILDEPERALSLPKQLELFKLLVQLTEKYQIIIATHSPFVLFEENLKIYDIEEGYAQRCIEIFKNCVKTCENQ